jgi:hypothetical protein
MSKVSYIIGFFLELDIVDHFILIKHLRYNHTNINSHKEFRHRSIIPKNKNFDRGSNRLN